MGITHYWKVLCISIATYGSELSKQGECISKEWRKGKNDWLPRSSGVQKKLSRKLTVVY
jgi:hypothetical protein